MSGDNLAEALKAIWDHIEKISTEMDKLRTCLQALQNDVQIPNRPIRMAGSSSNYAASSPTIGQPTMWNGSNQPVPCPPQHQTPFPSSNFNHGMNASTSGMQASANSPFMQPVAPNSALHGYQYGDASMFPHYNSNN